MVVAGRPLPDGRCVEDGGIWVVGLSKGSASDLAGIEQGDEVLQVEGQDLTAQSPFQVGVVVMQCQQQHILHTSICSKIACCWSFDMVATSFTFSHITMVLNLPNAL